MTQNKLKNTKIDPFFLDFGLKFCYINDVHDPKGADPGLIGYFYFILKLIIKPSCGYP